MKRFSVFFSPPTSEIQRSESKYIFWISIGIKSSDSFSTVDTSVPATLKDLASGVTSRLVLVSYGI